MNANIRESSFYVLENTSRRNTNDAPGWYMKNHPKRLVMEFKTATSIGLSGEFLSIFTITPWTDTSGGYPTQFAAGKGVVYVRNAIDVSTWGDWAEK